MEAILEDAIKQLNLVVEEAAKDMMKDGVDPNTKIDLANLVCRAASEIGYIYEKLTQKGPPNVAVTTPEGRD